MAIFVWCLVCIVSCLHGLYDAGAAVGGERHRIIAVNNAAQLFYIVEPYLLMPAGSVVAAFDIDKTVGVVDDPRLSSEYFDYNINTVRRLVPLTRWADPFATTMVDLCDLHEIAHMAPLDPDNSVAQVVWLLQHHGIPTFGLTARSVPLKRNTVRQVGQDLGIHFTRLSVVSGGELPDDLVWQPTGVQQVAPTAICNGIGFCGINSKGLMLRGMLSLLNLTPRIIIFADDDISKIHSVFMAYPDRYVVGIHMQVPTQSGFDLQQQLADDSDIIVINGRTYPKLYPSVLELIQKGLKHGSTLDLTALRSPTSPHYSPGSPGPFSCGSVLERER